MTGSSLRGRYILLMVCLLGSAFPGGPAARDSVSASESTLAPGDNPDFDGVSWRALGCDPPGDPQNDENPGGTDLVGDATYPVAYYGRDAAYLYFRYRVDGDPSGTDGFDQAAWVALVQTPAGDLFQYQYELALNGQGAPDDYGNTGSRKGDTVEIHQNTAPDTIDFVPLFNDPAEVRLWAQRHDFAGALTTNTTPLARGVVAGDGSSFGGNPDYFVEFAVPIPILISKGVISSASEIDDCLFFPATSTNANQYNKDILNCPFLPGTTIAIDKSVAPGTVPAQVSSPVTYTIVVTNTGSVRARGVVVTDAALPAWTANPVLTVGSDDPAVTWAVLSTNPLEVDVPSLPPGKSVTLALHVDAAPLCSSPDATNTVFASATNAQEVRDGATLLVQHVNGPEVCDGLDNDCDGSIDEGGNGLCDDGNACTDDSCTGATGCRNADRTGPCNDGNACTTADACSGGACIGGPPPNCDDGNLCTDDACNPANGCAHTDNAVPCSDGNACTTGDACSGGSCAGGPAPDCDDGNLCTDDACNPASGCGHVNNHTPCSDGNACTTADTCSGGACAGGPPPDCDDANVCTTDSCNPASGCAHTDNTTPCSDGNACTTADTCSEGACVGGTPPNCDDGNLCTDDGCSPASGCSHTDNTLPCSDDNACTTADTCSGGACVGGPPPNCDDANVCTNDACHPASGCVHANNALPCSDGNACTTADTCAAGECVGGAAPNCDDGNVCTNDACDPASGCTHANNTVSCSDSDACTTADRCSGGACAGGPPANCNDGNACTDDSCNPASGCVHAPNDGNTCSDGSACTTDACAAGQCVTTPVRCEDGNPCTDDGCDPATGCLYARDDSNACSDGNACTGPDRCASGVCVGGSVPECSDGNSCSSDSCSPATGCTFQSNDTCGGDPRTQGYWKRLCRGPHPSGDVYTMVDVDCVNDTCTFAALASVAEICDRLYPNPNNDKCEQAEAQFMALMLNECRMRVGASMALVSACNANTTVGQSALQADRLLCSPTRTKAECTLAQCVSEEINSGQAIGANTLRLQRLADGSIKLTWGRLGSETSTGSSHRIWRRHSSETAFSLIGQTSGFTWTDPVAADPYWQYEVTVVF